MKNKHIFLATITTVVLSACQTANPNWVAVGGSRADGTVKIAYEQPEMSQASPSMDAGKRLAAQRCQRWGYQDAEAFGGATRRCIRSPGFWTNCMTYQITFEYQCIGGQAEMMGNGYYGVQPVYVQPVYMQPVPQQQYQPQPYPQQQYQSPQQPYQQGY